MLDDGDVGWNGSIGEINADKPRLGKGDIEQRGIAYILHHDVYHGRAGARHVSHL